MAIDTIGTNAIANDAVTAAKIPAGAVDADITAIPDGSVSTAKLADNAVTGAKLYAENLGRRNIVINGDMTINQRYDSAAFTRTNAGGFGLDRYELAQIGTTGSPSAKVERVVDAPSGSGFYYSQKVTVVSAASGYAVGDHNLLQTKFEGLNTKHLLWGTSDAKTCTVSFWVKSSVTGTFSYYCIDGDASGGASYIAPFTISAANTWEKKTITVPGPTSGGVSEFPVDNSRSLYTGWNLGVGTSHQNATTNAWVYGTSTWVNSTSSTVKLMDTVNATFQVTGHQFEIGDTATDFEHRSFGEELSLCQRYYETSFEGGASTTNTNQAGVVSAGGLTMTSTTSFIGMTRVDYKVSKRAAATVTYYDFASPRNTGAGHRFQLGATAHNNSNVTIADNSISGFNTYSTGTGAGSGLAFHYEATSEL